MDPELVVRKFRTTTQHGAIEGKTQSHEIPFYNLDMIISLGYRIRSVIATRFRQWANKLLKDYLLRGYAINQRLLAVEERMDKKFSAITLMGTPPDAILREVK